MEQAASNLFITSNLLKANFLAEMALVLLRTGRSPALATEAWCRRPHHKENSTHEMAFARVL
jgi:hypothetical protein